MDATLLGNIFFENSFERVRAYLKEARDIPPYYRWWSRFEIRLLLETGDPESARRICEEEMARALALRQRLVALQVKRMLGEAYRDLGDFESARHPFKECLRVHWEQRTLDPLGECLEEIADLVWMRDHSVEAVLLWGVAAGLNESLGKRTFPLSAERIARQSAPVRAALGEEAFAALWAEGRAMPLEEAVGVAMRALADTGEGPPESRQ